MKNLTLSIIVILCAINCIAQNGLNHNVIQSKEMVMFRQIKLEPLKTIQFEMVLKNNNSNYFQSRIYNNNWRNSLNTPNYIPIIKGNPNGWDFPAYYLTPFNVRSFDELLIQGGLNFLLDKAINNK